MATKAENIKKLLELGSTKTEAELNDLSAPEVAKLVKEATASSKERQTSSVEEKSSPDEELEKADSVDVLRKSEGGGRPLYVRSYSREVHGEDFLALAKQFAAKYSKATLDENAAFDPSREHFVVPSVKFPEVIVSYREKEDGELPVERQNPDAPFVDKERKFADKEEALRFNLAKKGTIRVAK